MLILGVDKMSKPGFMSMRWLRLHIKEIIWATVVLFLLSLFVIGYGTTRMTQQNEEKQQRHEQAMADEDERANAVPEHLVDKLNLPVVHVSYPTQAASMTTVVDVKSIWNTVRQMRGYNEVKQMPKGIQEYYLDMFKEQAVEQLIMNALADMYTTVEKIKPTNVDAIVQADIAQFTPVEFNRRLRQEGLSIEDYKSDRLRGLVIRAIESRIIKPIPMASATEDVMKAFYEENKFRYALEDEVTFNHLLIAPDDFADKARVDEAAAKAYYEENKQEFMSSERVRVSQILINYMDQAYLDAIPVSEADLRDLYEANKNKYFVDEKVSARHILIKPIDSEEDPYPKALAKVETLLLRLENDASFEELAREFSEDSSASNGGDLGEFGRGVMVAPFEEAAFNAEEGEITKPVKTQFGYHIIKVDRKIAATEKSFEAVKDEITQELKLKQAEIKAANDLEDAKAQIMYQGKDFASFMHLSNVESGKNKGKLPIFFKGRVGEDYAEADAKLLKAELCDYMGRISSEIEEAVYGLNAQELSAVVLTPKGYHLFKLEEKLEPTQLGFYGDVKRTITQRLEKEDRERLAAEQAQEYQKHNSNLNVLELAKLYKPEGEPEEHSYVDIPYTKNPGFSSHKFLAGRGSFSDNGRTYTPEFHKALSELLRGEWKNRIAGPFKTQFGWHFVEITDHKTGRYEPFEDVKDSIRQLLVLEPTNDEVDKFYDENKEQFKIAAARDIRQIIVQSEYDANAVYSRLEEGEIFMNIIKSYSSDSNAGMVVSVEKERLPLEVADAIWALTAKGQYTKPIKTAYGYVVAMYEGKETLEGVRSLAEVDVSIREQLRQNYRIGAFESFFKGLYSKSYVTRNEKLLKEI